MGPLTIERPALEDSPVSGVDIELEEQPPYGVILHNDDINSFEWVVKVLNKVFGYGYWKSLKMALRAHRTGQCIVWSGSLEVAELRADQIVSCGPDPGMLRFGARPLRVSLEPMP